MKIISRLRQNTATKASTVRLLRTQACNNHQREHWARCTVTRNTRKHIPLAKLSTTRAAPHKGEQDRIDFRSRVPPTRRKNVHKHPGADAEHVSTVELSIARKECHELRLRKPDDFQRSLHHHMATRLCIQLECPAL